jgi:hypothetical protein
VYSTQKNHIMVLYRVVIIVNSSNHYSNKYNKSRHNNKSDIINVTKGVARKSVLMQITRAKAANGFH